VNKIIISDEAETVLKEIITNEENPGYWIERFDNVYGRDDVILRGCFAELKEAGMINVIWADDRPYIIRVLKDGYLYEKKEISAKDNKMTKFEIELNDLIRRSESINPPIQAAEIGKNINEYNSKREDWINDVEIFYNKYLKQHSLSGRITTILFHRSSDAFDQLKSCLRSISKDQDFINKMKEVEEPIVQMHQAKIMPEYDVFLSHANKDKVEIVDDLNNSLEKLGVKIFYDKKSLEWGDNWKDRILDGTQKAEFAIIVISENFFDREWTEKELKEFLSRQNRDGQKLILPIVHNITNVDLRKKYPYVADIQAIDSSKYSCDEIALLFARQLIKRLKHNDSKV